MSKKDLRKCDRIDLRKLMIPYYMTEACNLKCSYCYVSDTTNRKLFEPSLVKVEDCLPDWLTKTKFDASLIFIGGEPLLEFEKIKRIVNKLKENRARTTFTIATNLTLLTDEMLEFIIENDIHINISLDSVSGFSRPYRATNESSYLDVMKNIEKLKKSDYIKKKQISVFTILSEYNFDTVLDMCEYIAENKFSWGVNYPNCNYTEGAVDLKKTNEVIKKIVDKLYDLGHNLSNDFRLYEIQLNGWIGCLGNPTFHPLFEDGLIRFGRDPKVSILQEPIAVDFSVEWNIKHCIMDLEKDAFECTKCPMYELCWQGVMHRVVETGCNGERLCNFFKDAIYYLINKAMKQGSFKTTTPPKTQRLIKRVRNGLKREFEKFHNNY